MFIMVVLKLPTTNETLKDWEQHKGIAKLCYSVPHGIHCFKVLSKAVSHSSVQ